MKNIKINTERLHRSLEQLALIGKDECGGITRLALSSDDKEARDLLVKWMKAEGLQVVIDEIGNITGLRKGLNSGRPVMIGSHIDTVISGGRYDGSLGVLSGLEIIRAMNEQNIITQFPIALSIFTNEEGIRYTPDMMGSLVWAGGLSINQALETSGTDGSLLGEELRKIGYQGTHKCGALIPYCYLELHIEQGPVLENENVEIGVVENLQGISWTEVIITGESNHAGTTPMNYRKDAGYAAAKIINFLPDICRSVGNNQLATCGNIFFEPNVVNVVPGKARLKIDLRNVVDESLEMAECLLDNFIRELSTTNEVEIETRRLVRLKPVSFDESLLNRIEKKAQEMHLISRRMTSGAGHDAQMMARICPAAMIFVPSKGGISHNPKEFTEPELLEKGANLLLNVLMDLAKAGRKSPE